MEKCGGWGAGRLGGRTGEGSAGARLSAPSPPAGVKVLFRVGLTLVRLALGTSEQRQACPGLLETLGALRAVPPTQLQEEGFMSQVGVPARPWGARLGLSAWPGGTRKTCPRSLTASTLSHFLSLCRPEGTSRLPAPPSLCPQVHSVALSEQDLQREIRTQLAQLPASPSGPPPRPQARLPGAQAIFEAQQLAGAQASTRSTKPQVPSIIVQPPEEPAPPKPQRKPQTRGKTFHGLLTRARGPPIQGPPRSHRGSTSFLDTRF